MTDGGGNDAFARLYEEEFARLCRLLYIVGRCSWEDAADVTQNTFVELLGVFDTVAAPRAWLRTAARRNLIDLQRSRQAQDAMITRMRLYGTVSAGPVYHADEPAWVEKALLELPERQREVLAWSLDGYAAREIAAELGITSNAVSSSLRLAKRRLAELHRAQRQGGE